MGKTGGTSDAEKVRILRKELAEAKEHLRYYRRLRRENAELRQENAILKELAKPVEERSKSFRTTYGGSSKQLSQLNNSIKGALAQTEIERVDRNDHGSPRSRKLDIGRSLKIGNKRHVYHAGTLITLTHRLSRLAELPHYMHPTQASEAKGSYIEDNRSSYYYPGFLRKGTGAARYKPQPEEEVTFRESYGYAMQREQQEYERMVDSLRYAQDEYVLAHLEPEPPEKQKDFSRLDVEPKVDLQEVRINGLIGKSLLERGLRLFQESFRAAARMHMPAYWVLVQEGPDFVRCGYTEMSYNISRNMGGLKGLVRICPYDPTGLNRFLLCTIPTIRNKLCHAAPWKFNHVGQLDEDLREIQKCLLLMGDGPRAKGLRDLRDEVIREAEEHVILSSEREAFASLPLAEEFEEPWDPSFPGYDAWEGLIVDEDKKTLDEMSPQDLFKWKKTEATEWAKKLYEEHGFEGTNLRCDEWYYHTSKYNYLGVF